MNQLVLRADGVCVVLDTTGPALPRVLYWGADPGPLDADGNPDADADAELLLGLAVGPVVASSGRSAQFPLLPAEADLWSGTPGISGHRDGAGPFPRLELTGLERPDGGWVVVRGADRRVGLEVVLELVLEPGGLLRTRTTLTSAPTGETPGGTGAPSYTLDGLTTLLPVPAQARELLDLTGRWCAERTPQRSAFHQGTRLRANRRGRTGHDATLVLCAGTPGFGFRHGEVWAVHVAWSGDHVHLAERLPEGAGSGGAGVIGGGELLLPGEIRLAAGESYTSPWVCFAYSDQGLDGVSARFHRYLRSRPGHPRGPRPLVLNSWEAVYFDHGYQRLEALARRAAEVGAERFVLDDGWFLGRRDDTAGLGDWYVDPAVWPDGLRPLADRVHELGMQFGLWVEPEMVNPDSDLARAHPDWVLAEPGRWPLTARNQQVLDVAHPDAWSYLLERLDALVREIGIDYLKWDHNRDLHEAVHAVQGVPSAGVHRQTLAVYRLLDALRERHPALEIESCSSGGARVDLGILQRTDRVWGSDSNDAHDRQSIQRWTAMLLPPELVGCHVGPPTAHTTGRTASLTFRALTALFGHAGIEWDITTCTDEELRTLQGWAALYKELRGLLHSGDVVRADHPDDGTWLHGVVARDRSEAVFCYARLQTSPDGRPARLRLPGLDPASSYRVVRRDDAGRGGVRYSEPPWWTRGELTATGRALETIGLAAPLLNPDDAVLLHLTVLRS